MMSLVRAQLGEPQQSSLLTTLFSFLSKFTAKSGEKVSVNKSVLWTVFSELGLCECCLRTKHSMRGSYFPSLQSKLGEPENFTLLYVVFHRLHSKQFHGAVDVWKRNFNHVELLFYYGSAVRKVMCTNISV